MTAPLSVERAKAYLDVQLQHVDAAPHRIPSTAFVTISRETGAGGSMLAELLCRRLNLHPAPDQPQWTALDREIVEQMLTSQGLSADLARFLPEDRVPEVRGTIGEIVGLHPDVWTLVQRTTELMRRVAHAGSVVLVGRGANFATAGIEHGFHVRLIGSEESRMQRLCQQRTLTPSAALSHLRKTDTARRDYVRSYYDRMIDDPLAYDLVINTDHIPPAQAASLVISALDRQGR